MSVVAFPRGKQGEQGWRSSEIDRLLPVCAARNPDVQSFAVGNTERGDPQLYVLGPQPERECILCVTRLGNLYVMEDGAGRVVFENTNLALLVEQIPAALSRSRAALISKLLLMWATVRQTVEQKTNPCWLSRWKWRRILRRNLPRSLKTYLSPRGQVAAIEPRPIL